MSVPYTFGTNTYAQSGQLDANFAALNSGLSNIDASQITTGTLPVARGGTGASTAPAALTSLGAVAKAGDTMTGPLSGTSATFSGSVTANGSLITDVSSGSFSGYNARVASVDQWDVGTGGGLATAWGLVQSSASGAIRIYVTNTGACSASSAWGVISDASLKTGISDQTRGLADILKVRPRKYRYNGKQGLEGDGHGFIAQELGDIMPELVRPMTINTDGDEVLTVVETGLIGPLIQALKELAAKVEALEKGKG